ncbi:MAG: nucleotidyltransferase family protein [Lachnospiraceae bacterium]|nr:nucleotidyltransferase family protein [Lachnospiraceae bacterium]
MEGKNIGCVIMASGISRRFGSNKLLAHLDNNTLIFDKVLEATDTPSFANRVVITRHKEIKEICNEKNVRAFCHCYPNQNETIRLGITILLKHTPNLFGCLYTVSDQPFLTKKSLETMVKTFKEINSPDAICRLSYNGIPGNPVLYGSEYFSELATIPSGFGGGYILKKYPEKITLIPAENEMELFDIDTPTDLQKAVEYNSRLH